MSRVYYVHSPGATLRTIAENPEQAVQNWATWAQRSGHRFQDGIEYVEIEGVKYEVRLQVHVYVSKIER